MQNLLRSVAAFLASGVATVAAYLALLGWDQEKELGPDGYLHGPYSAWQVVAMMLILVGIAWAAGTMHHGVAGVAAATIALTVAFSVDAANDFENDGLWPIGAAMIGAGTAGGLALVAFLAYLRQSQRGFATTSASDPS